MTKQAELIPAEPAPLAKRDERSDLQALLDKAVDKEVPVEALEKLVSLYERVTDRQAAAAFNRALADFQSECPPIPRKSRARIGTSGTPFEYRYAELDTIAETIRPLVKRHGFSYCWDETFDGGNVTATCKLRHEDGHSETASFTCPTETRAGMSPQQKHASALTFAKRQSLTSVLGLTTTDPDDDGASPETISDEQVSEIAALLTQMTETARQKFLTFLGVEDVTQIKRTQFSMALKSARNKVGGR